MPSRISQSNINFLRESFALSLRVRVRAQEISDSLLHEGEGLGMRASDDSRKRFIPQSSSPHISPSIGFIYGFSIHRTAKIRIGSYR